MFSGKMSLSRTVRLSASMIVRSGGLVAVYGGPLGVFGSAISAKRVLVTVSIACPVTFVEATGFGYRERIMKLGPGPHRECAKAAQPIIAQEPSAAGVTRGTSGGAVTHPSAYSRPWFASYSMIPCGPPLPALRTPHTCTLSAAVESAAWRICGGNVAGATGSALARFVNEATDCSVPLTGSKI